MQGGLVDVRARARSGAEALRAGDPARARSVFQRLVDEGRGDGQIWLGLAFAARDLKDTEGALLALEQALAFEPRNIRALMLKADVHAQAGEDRVASGYYSQALKAAPPPEQTPPDLQRELARARAMAERYAGAFEAYLRERMAAEGFAEGRSSRRFAESLDVLVGRKTVYLQQPRFHYFPGLPQIQFYERGDFPWLREVESATDAIRGELLEVLKQEGAFTPYVEPQAMRHAPDAYGLLNNPDWSAFYLWKSGRRVEENLARCPRTAAALDGAPLARISERTPSVLFSLLRAGARIPQHTGYLNARLICHLPLIVPPGCALRVGNETREWREGEALIFDDSIEHEAWNTSDRLRVVLLFDVWRPELTDEERALVSAMVRAVDDYGGGAADWG